MKVINVSVKNLKKLGYKNFQDWEKHSKNVYIGRSVHWLNIKSSIWYNPFSVNKYGREKALKLYKKYIMSDEKLKFKLKKLKGKNLGCWCSPLPCHGDILKKLVKKLSELN